MSCACASAASTVGFDPAAYAPISIKSCTPAFAAINRRNVSACAWLAGSFTFDATREIDANASIAG